MVTTLADVAGKAQIELYAIRPKGYQARMAKTSSLEGIAVVDASVGTTSSNSSVYGLTVQFWRGQKGELESAVPEFIVYSFPFPKDRFYKNFIGKPEAWKVLNRLRKADQRGNADYVVAQEMMYFESDMPFLVIAELLELPASEVLQTPQQRELAKGISAYLKDNLETLVGKLKPFTQVHRNSRKGPFYTNVCVLPKDRSVVPQDFNTLDLSSQRLWHYGFKWQKKQGRDLAAVVPDTVGVVDNELCANLYLQERDSARMPGLIQG